MGDLMKKRFIPIVSLILLVTFILSSCSEKGNEHFYGSSLGGEEKRLTVDEYKIAAFENGAPHGFWARDDRGNGHPDNCSPASGLRCS